MSDWRREVLPEDLAASWSLIDPEAWVAGITGPTLGEIPGPSMQQARPDNPLASAISQFRQGTEKQGSLADLALTYAAAIPGSVGDAQQIGNQLGFGPQQLAAKFGLPPMSPLPGTHEIAKALGANPETRTGFLGEMLAPMPNELGALAGPLLHASPFKFDFFDLKNVRKGEGAIAYSPNAIYFSSDDLVTGSHGNYLSQFGRHKELRSVVTIGGKTHQVQDVFDEMGRVDFATDTRKFNEVMRGLGLDPLDDQWKRGQVYRALEAIRDYHVKSADELHNLFGVDRDVARLFSKEGRAERVVELEAQVKKWRGLLESGTMADDAMEQRAKKMIAKQERWIDELRSTDITFGKGEPYSYRTVIRDDIEHELPIYDDRIKDQPKRYRENVENLARSMFDIDVAKAELAELEESTAMWKELLSQPVQPSASTGFGLTQSQRLRAKQRLRRNERQIAELKRQIAKDGFDPDRTFGELVNELKDAHGDEGARRIMMEYGVPGSRNETWRSRNRTTSPIGALAYLTGKQERGFNYAIWDLDLVDEVVRRQTKGGKILEDTAETVYRRLRPTASLAQDAGPAKDGYLRFRHFRKRNFDTLQPEHMGEGIRGAEAARGPDRPNVLSLYPDEGFVKEAGLGNVEYVIDIPESQLYNASSDPLNLRAKAMEPSGPYNYIDGELVPTGSQFSMNKYEQLIKDEGFFGYHTPDAEGNLRGQARIFHDINVGKERP